MFEAYYLLRLLRGTNVGGTLEAKDVEEEEELDKSRHDKVSGWDDDWRRWHATATYMIISSLSNMI